jgi:hypothetical protein
VTYSETTTTNQLQHAFNQQQATTTDTSRDAISPVSSTTIGWSQVDVPGVNAEVANFVELFIKEAEAVEATFLSAQTQIQTRVNAMINAPSNSRGLEAEAVDLFRQSQFVRNYALLCYSDLLHISLLPAVAHVTRLPVISSSEEGQQQASKGMSSSSMTYTERGSVDDQGLRYTMHTCVHSLGKAQSP